VSDTDSFIEEVTEEVRRDRLFALMKKYGWIAVAAVVLIVGGAAYNEWRKAQADASAQALGDEIVAALAAGDGQAQIDALRDVQAENPAMQALVTMMTAAEMVKADNAAGAIALLDGIASQGDVPAVYRQLAAFKSLLVQGDDLSVDERRTRLEGMAQTVPALRLPAEEQLALLDVKAGQTDAAIDRLQRIVDDAEATEDLRRRASQLIVSLGGQVDTTAQAGN
jgi:hypothetical protein